MTERDAETSAFQSKLVETKNSCIICAQLKLGKNRLKVLNVTASSNKLRV
jgi:hypothetical protein